MSLPVWEEWIEIGAAEGTVTLWASLPVWEEWIEIICSCFLPPQQVNVSSRIGRVD